MKNRSNQPRADALVSHAAKAMAIGMAVLCLAACGGPGVTEDKSISQITITNIPKTIGTKETFKVYLNASNKIFDVNAPSAARGQIKVSEGTEMNTTYTVIIQLQEADDSLSDTSENTPGWSGTAAGFSLAISPQNPANKDEIIAKGYPSLNSSRAQMSWESNSIALNSTQLDALWNRLIANDWELTLPPSP